MQDVESSSRVFPDGEQGDQPTTWLPSDNDAPDSLDSEDEIRDVLMLSLDYLATMLGRGIGGFMAGRDPTSSRLIVNEFDRRAECIRQEKRSLLFNQATEWRILLERVEAWIIAGARRQWLSLPGAEPRGR